MSKKNQIAEINDLLGQLQEGAKKIEETLAKSYSPMAKDGEEEMPPEMGESAPGAGEPAPEAAPGEGAPGAEEGMDEESLEEALKSMSDEDLDELCQKAMAEKAARASAGAPPEAGAGEPAPEAGAGEPEMNKSMEHMQKSMTAVISKVDQIAAANEKLTSENANLRKEIESLKKRPATRVAAPMAKSADAPPKMVEPARIVSFLEANARSMKQGAALDLVQDAMQIQSPEDSRRVYAKAEQYGIKLPME